MTNPFTKIRDFLTEVVTELKRSSWPTRKELIDSTVIVLVTMLLFGIFVSSADFLFVKIVELLTGAS